MNGNTESIIGYTAEFIAPTGTETAFFKGFSSDTPISLKEPEKRGNELVYVLTGLVPGPYSYVVSGEGLYTVRKLLNLSEEKLGNSCVIRAVPMKKAGTGFEPNGEVVLETDEMDESAFSFSPENQADFKTAFSVPTFSHMKREAGAFQSTTAEETAQWISDAVSKNPNAYRYSLGESAVYRYDIPAVFLTETDLSAAKSWQDAAALVKASGKLTVLYCAQIHGNEPAGKDGALAMLREISEETGGRFLKKMNLVIVPCQNPDGAHNHSRLSAEKSLDMNRDHLRAETREVRLVHALFYALLPEVFIDGHEYNTTKKVSETPYSAVEAMIGTGATLNNGEGLLKIGEEVLGAITAAFERYGIRYAFYPRIGYPYNTLNAQNPTTGRAYFSLTGTAVFLVESRGIGIGLNHYARRMATQVMAIRALLDEVYARVSEIRETVQKEREMLLLRGRKPSADDVFVLGSEKDGQAFTHCSKLYDPVSGAVTGEKSVVAYETRIPVLSVPRAKAYVLPASLPRIKEILSVMDAQGISYRFTPSVTDLPLKQVAKKEAGALRTPTFEVSESGYVLFSMAQISANVLAFLMEPGATDSGEFPTSLIDMGFIPESPDGSFPIYRM